MVVTSYKVNKNIELANTEPLFLGEIQTWVLPTSGRNIFIKQSIRRFVLSVLLFKGTLFNTYCWVINIRLSPVALQLMIELSLSGTSQPSCAQGY